MNVIRVLSMSLLCGVALAQTSNEAAQIPKRSDAEQLVALVLADNASSPTYGMSFVQTALNRMGDKAALGVLQYLGERKTTVSEDSTSAEEVKMILYIVRTSFAAPSLIDSEENRAPKATMVLLKYLGSLRTANTARDDLQQTIELVERIKRTSPVER
ncbi:MAG TPA: hypothetical protein VKE93_04750 [Candidatus Angelobacter sp.]|nr:hypothetical protein [Candidatus Angelobacter sp.]